MDGDDVCGFVEAFTATELPHENDWDVRFYSVVFSHVHTCPLTHTCTYMSTYTHTHSVTGSLLTSC